MHATADATPAIRESHDRALPGGRTDARWRGNDLNISDREGIARFAQLLKAAGYPGSTAKQTLGQQLGTLHRRRDLPLFLRRLQGPEELKTLSKLFAFQVPVTREEAERALRGVGLERCEGLGVIRVEGDEVLSRINIASCENLFIAHDPAAGSALEETQAEHVLGVSPPTLVLARLTLRERARRALDLGTGNGVQALLAAAHCDEVVGTDLNPRALVFAQFNALMNGISNVEFRLGSLFEPVEGENFDLVISNPPYVISPESTYLYRDGGKKADGFCENLVRELPRYLREGGFACMLANWAHYQEEHWSAPIRRWVEGSGCDCWALHGQEHEPLSYAADWNRHRERSAYEQALDEWSRYYEELGIHSISSGGIVMRRKAGGKNWFRADELGGEMHPLSEGIVRSFAAEDYLARMSDAELLDEALARRSTHKLIQTMVPDEGDYTVESMRLESTHFPPFTASMDMNALHLLRRCDGKRPLGVILAEVAERTGGDLAECKARGLQIVRGLLAQGVLAPSADIKNT